MADAYRFSLKILLLPVLLSASGLLAAQSVEPVEIAPNTQAGGRPPLPLEDLRTFAEVLERVKASYVEPVDDKTLLENAIKGMLSNLDPHSDYLDPKAFASLQESTTGEFEGLGLELGQKDGVIEVISPIDDSPAARAGIQPGDLIIKINELPTTGLSLMEASEKMRGKKGDRIVLTIVREGGRPFPVTLARDKIKLQSVRTELLTPDYGYIRISQFQGNTGDEARKALEKLKKQNGGKNLQGLILDLRNNPGGLLQGAVAVSDQFLTRGLIVYTKGRMPNAEVRFYAEPGDSLEGAPMVVLINGGTASAAEIVSGALQDQKRAVIMGTDSFGKGSVQTVLPLKNKRAIKLTTALYFTPNGRSIQAQGITPDIEVLPLTVTPTQGGGISVREADLQGHLGNAFGGQERGSNADKKKEQLQDKDYQVSQALSLLKGLNLVQNKESALR